MQRGTVTGCGGEICTPLHLLSAGYRKSCGCLSCPAKKDYIGQRFGCLQSEIYRDNLKLIDGASVTILKAGKKVLSRFLYRFSRTRSAPASGAKKYTMIFWDGATQTILQSRKSHLAVLAGLLPSTVVPLTARNKVKGQNDEVDMI